MSVLGGIPEKQGCHLIPRDKSSPHIPLNSDSRKVTDIWFLLIFILCIALLVPFLVYTLFHADINRYNGYDDCGNVCGQKNTRYDPWDCSGQDMTLKPILYDDQCVSDERYAVYPAIRTHIKNFYPSLSHILYRLSLACYIPFGFSIVLAVLFKYATAYTVWAILVTSWIFFPASAINISLSIRSSRDPAITYVFIMAILFCVSIRKRDQIALVIKLVKPAADAVLLNGRIIINAAMASVVSSAIMLAYCIANYYINSAGILAETWDRSLDFVSDIYMVVTCDLNGFISYWLVLFIVGVVFLTTSGAIASRYFSRHPVGLTSGASLKYHSGTVALVSLLSTLMIFPRLILIILVQISPWKKFTGALRYLDGFLSQNVYVMTAMYGTSFNQSRKKAVELSRSSVDGAECLHYFGYALMVSAQTLVVIGSTFLSDDIYDLFYISIYDYVIIFPVSYISTEFVLGPFKAAMSSIFFCICQDNFLKQEAKEPQNTSLEEYLDMSDTLFAVEKNWLPSNIEYIGHI